MGFKWIDKTANDPVSENDINAIGQAVEALFEEVENGGGGGGGSGTDIKVPTKTSELENDSGFITGNDVPKKLSELEADSITRSDHEPFDFSAYIANFAGHEAEFSFDNLTFRNMGYGSGVSFDGQPLHDVGAPEADTDGASKGYVDNAVNGIPSWAKQPTKPTYTATEVGAVTPAYVDEKLGEIIGSAESIPNYWIAELETKADAIQQAMEKAGRNKSAFLWYTDAHWQYSNAKKSPVLLDYLIKNTPINKVNFGGDIVSDPTTHTHDNITYVYEWRRMISGLPNHHSVIGNHDFFHKTDSAVSDEIKNIAYATMIAPEESYDMTVGGAFYYYIDNKSEKTRYLYLDSGNFDLSDDETSFVINALNTLEKGWHVVAINHIWFQYTASSEPTVGSINPYCQKLLKVFDDYNARKSGTVVMVETGIPYDFTNAEGKVEFCVGGHIHYDYDLKSNGGIPIVLTAPDSYQVRGGDTYVIGTITESAVGAFIADYNQNILTVVGVGRMKSRVINLLTTDNYTNLFDTSADGYLENTRLSTSSTSVLSGNYVTNYIPCNVGDIIRIKGLDVRKISNGNARFHLLDGNKALAVSDCGYVETLIANGYGSVSDDIITLTAGYTGNASSAEISGTKYMRFCGILMDGYTIDDVVITVNEEIV